MRTRRQDAERRGRQAEHIAMLRLSLTGWRILGWRVQTPAGELDLIAARGRTLAFVEVKQRAGIDAGLHALAPRQRDRLLRAAALWRGRHPHLNRLTPRFDVMIIRPWRWPVCLTGAFDADVPAGRDLI